MSTGRDSLGDLDKVQIHGLGIAGGQDEGCTLSLLWTDRAEDIGGSGPLIAGCMRTGAAPSPPTRDLVLLADTRLVLEPNLYCGDIDGLFACDFLQTCWEAFMGWRAPPQRRRHSVFGQLIRRE